MAIYNKHVNIARTYYDLNNRFKEIEKAIENKEIDDMSAEDFEKYLSFLTKEVHYVEQSKNVIKNVSRNTWTKDNAKASYNTVNEKINKLKQLGFYDVISPKENTPQEMLNKVLAFNSLNKEIFLSEQKGGVTNESIRSFKDSYEYFMKLKAESLKEDRSFFVFDLETTGGKNLNGVWEPDSITEFSLQEFDFTGTQIKNHTMIVGLEEKEGEEIIKEIEQAIQDGTLASNEKLRVSAMRYAAYGDNKTTHVIDEATGLWRIKDFAEVDDMYNIDKIRKGVNLFVKAGKDYNDPKNMINGIRRDHYYMGVALQDMYAKMNNSTAALIGQNHIGHDMPIIQNQWMKWQQKYRKVTDMFNLNLDFDDPSKTLDLFGGTRPFIEYFGVSSLYPNSTMEGAKKVAGQEYMAQLHVKKWFEDLGLNAHKAEDDVTALALLVTKASELLGGDTTVLEHIYNGLSTVDTTNTLLEENKHILRAKKRAGSYGGKGYINFATDSEGTIYTASDHILGGKDKVSQHVGGALHENFNVGFGVNKGGFYQIDKIQQLKLTDELRYALGDLAPEYSGQNLYHVQLSMAVTDKYKDSRLGDLKQNFFFKNKKELEGFLSAQFDVVAERGEKGVKLRKEHLDKLDIRELQDVKGQARFVDKLGNWQKNPEELLNQALDFQANKVLTSRAENTFLRNSSYSKIKKALALENKILDIFKEANIEQDNLSQRELNRIMSGNIASGNMAMPLNNEQIMRAQDIIQQTLSYQKNMGESKIDRLLDSTIDNYSSIMGFISNNKTVLTNIMSHVEDKLGGYSDEYKQEMFARIYDAAKREVAEHIYRNSDNTNPAKAIGIYTDKRLQTNLHDFKNMYEIDFSSLAKNTGVSYITIEKPEEFANLHRFDVSSKSPMYSIIDKATQAVFGKDYKGKITDEHKQVAIEELFSTLMKEDKDLSNTQVIKDFKKTFGYKNNKFEKRVNFLNIADTIISGMQEVKANDQFAGIKNLRYSFMKSLEGNPSFIAALNSKDFQHQLNTIADDIIKNTDIHLITQKYGSKDADLAIGSIVDRSLMKYYVPDAEKVQKLIGNDDRKMMLYEKGVKDIREYLVDTIKGFSYIQGTEISIQDDGALLIKNGGNAPLILNKLPKMKLDEDSKTLYGQVGGKQVQFFKKMLMDVEGNNVVGDVGTTFSQLNKYSNSKAIRNIVNSKGEVAGLEAMMSKIGYDLKKLGEGPTINSFSGNDIDSNYLVDMSDIKNLLPDLFGEKGRLKHYVDNSTYADQELHDVLKQKLAKAGKDKNGNLKDLSPDITRDIVKDAFHIIDDVARQGNVSDEFLQILNNTLSFTGQWKKVSGMIAYEGKERPHNSTFGVFDNTQRPTITQSGNAKFLRLEADRIKALKEKGVWMGNIVDTEYSLNKTVRKFAGIGETTTDVMLNTYYAGNQALKVIMDTNLNTVLAKSKVDFKTEEAARSVHEFIKESISTFEQERIMDSRIFEDIYGLQSAQTQKLSKGIDIKSISKDLTEEELEQQKRFIGKHLGDIKFVNGDVVYESAIGTHIKKGQGTIKSKGFADLTSSFTAKVKDGVFNHYYYNSAGMKLSDEDINKIIQENKSFFKRNGEFLNTHSFRATLDQLLESKGIVGQFVIEDMNALGYAKTMTSGSEKGMTDILYATTGKYNQEVKKVFENIGAWDTVKSKVLTEEALKTLVVKDKNDSSYLQQALKGTSFKSFDDLKKAMQDERHLHSKMLFEYALGGKTHLIANDNVIGHGNFGQMYQGSLSKAIDLISKKHEDGLEGAVQTIVDMINGEGKYADKNFKFMENWDLSKNKIDISHIGVKKVGDRLLIDQNFFTQDNMLSNLNASIFNDMLRHIDKEFLSDNAPDSDERLVRRNVHVLESKADGSTELKAVKEMVGAYYSTKIDGKTVILGAQTKENTKVVTDVETQSGVTDEYFTIKKALTNLKKEKIDLEAAIHKTDDNATKSILNEKLIKVKNEINKAQQDVNAYEGVVKTMRIGDQELSIIDRVVISQAQVDKINDLISKNEIDASAIDTLALRGKIHIDGEGKLKATSDFNLDNIIMRNADGTIKAETGEGIRVLDWFTQKVKKQQWYDEVKDVKLEASHLDLDEYKHLENVYNYFTNKGQDVGIDKAQEVYQMQMAVDAKKFNSSAKNKDNIGTLESKGFKQVHINDLTLDVEALSTRNLIVDLGDEFSSNHSYRYIAVPGTGKLVVDEDLKRKSHSKLVALKHKYDEFLGVKGSNKEEEVKLKNEIMSLSDDITKDVDAELFNKKGIMHNMSKVEMSDPVYRTKLSGVIGSHFDNSLAITADGKKLDLVDSLNSVATQKAMIGERTIAEWEKMGVHHDYKFVSREQFDNLGYFSEERLKQFGFLTDKNTKEDAIALMEEHLQTHGTIDLFDRFPNTRTGSIVPTTTFLDTRLTQNQSKVSVSTVMKANGDMDGDSGSNLLLRFTDDQGRQIDGSYMKRVKSVALENLAAEGVDTKTLTAQQLAEAAEATGMISKEDFEHFHQLEAKMQLDAMGENQKWANKGKKIITKDNIKNVKLGDISNAAMLEDGYSELLNTNAFARLSQMPKLDDYNAVQDSANEIIQTAQQLDKEHNYSKGLMKTGADDELKAWDKFHGIDNIRTTNSTEAMDKALAIIENASKDGKISTDYLEAAKITAVKRIGHDKYVQEMMAHTGLPAVGNVNLSLNAIKLATQFTENSPKDTLFTNFIWEALDVAEQGVISSKKLDNPGLDDTKIAKFSEAMKNIYAPGQHQKNRKAAINQLSSWMDENAGDVFEVAYEEMGKYVFGSKEFNKMSKEQGIKEMKQKFLNHLEETSTNQRFLSIKANLELVGRNGNHDNKIWDAIPASINENFLSANTMEAAGYADKARSEAMRKLIDDEARRKMQRAANQEAYEEGIAKSLKEVTAAATTSGADDLLKHASKIPMGGSGIGTAMVGLAAGLLVSGYASGNPLKDKSAQTVAEGQAPPKQTMSVPQFMEQGGMVTGNSQQGYVINLQADTKKGRKYMKQMMAQAAQASVGGAVSVNVNLRDVSKNGITDKDIEDYMNRHL